MNITVRREIIRKNQLWKRMKRNPDGKTDELKDIKTNVRDNMTKAKRNMKGVHSKYL